jgi:hypothetical protein
VHSLYPKSKIVQSGASSVLVKSNRGVLSRGFSEFLPALMAQLLHGLHQVWQISKFLALPLNFWG